MITLKPWQFPLASAESRAAARAILENREEDTRRRVELILNGSRPARTRARATTLEQSAFGRTVVKGQRRDAVPPVYIPTVWERAPYAGEAPVCPACGMPYSRNKDWAGRLLFEAA